MKLTIENIAKVKNAEIVLNGITVIAGYNGTGKSSISKSLYAVTTAFSGLKDRALLEKKKSILHILKKFISVEYLPESTQSSMEKISDELKNIAESEEEDNQNSQIKWILSQEKQINEHTAEELQREILSVIKRPLCKYENFLIEKSVRSVFHGQLRSKQSEGCSKISLSEENSFAEVLFKGSQLYKSLEKNFIKEPAIYIGTLNVLDIITKDMDEFSYIDRLQALLQKRVQEREMTYEEYQKHMEGQTLAQSMLSALTGGRMIKEGNRFRFFDHWENHNIDFSNLSSGIKTFVILQTLIENGALKEGSILIIDEPEVNLHPEWQLKFAEILVLLQKELRIKMLLNTHSPYFLRAVEIYLAENNLATSGKFYFMEETAQSCLCTDVTENTEIIYKALYNPLENL